MNTQIVRQFLFFALHLFLLGCSNTSPYLVGDTTKNHPATQTFIDFIKATKHSNNFDDVIDYYNDDTHGTINKAIGWYKFAYTAVYKALKQGADCAQITTTRQGKNKARIDCIGDYTFKSHFLGTSQEDIHIQVNMIKKQDKWYLLQSGYAHTQNNRTGREYNRIGIKFHSIFDH